MDMREEFLQYFKNKEHLILPSSSLIPANDPSVLLTTAGMQQFKPYYLGTEKPPATRIATVQKCFRTSDIDSVGYTDRHLTFFEMLGNFSFGDYFKKEAIEFAIDFCTNELKLPREKLMAAVFSGNSDVPADEESIKYWIDNGIKKENIYRFGKEENFWGPAGTTGPCGPCTEIYYDYGPGKGCGKKDCDPSCDCGRFLEVWNLVFTQYNFDGNKYTELPKKNIDTGMGLERIVAVIEGKKSVFETSLFSPILDKVFKITGKKLNGSGNEETDRALRILADHSRAIYFLLADGVTPSNEGRGYILRRIIRRAVRFGKMLGTKDYFLNDIGEAVMKQYSKQYGELAKSKDLAYEIVLDEEKRFTKTLKEGNLILGDMIKAAKGKKAGLLDPRDAFRLYETYGFPVELTIEILKESDLGLDLGEYEKYFKEHVEKSKKKTTFDKKVDKNIPLYKKLGGGKKTEFLGYEKEKIETVIEGIIRLSSDGSGESVTELDTGQKGEIILAETVFYGEKGGQTGDEGVIKSKDGAFTVNDTQIPLEDIFIHRGSVREGKIKCGDKVEIEINHKKRNDTRKNHTSTHLLHWALRNLLGDQVKQSGSMVSDTRLRFDYSVYNSLSGDELNKIEKMVNEKIQKDDPVRSFETTMDYAKELDVVALFDEKYGKYVRVIEIGGYNRELCGGTHASRTGEIGLFKILSDSSIGANLRRIEAVTGMHAYDMVSGKEEKLKKISDIMEVGEESLEDAVTGMKQDSRRMEEELGNLRIGTISDTIFEKFKQEDPGAMKIVDFDITELDQSAGTTAKDMGTVADRIKVLLKNKNIFIVLGNVYKGKPVMVLACTKDIAGTLIDCGKMAREVGKIIKGGGGGRPDFAQLGGSDAKSLAKAIDFAVKKARESLEQI